MRSSPIWRKHTERNKLYEAGAREYERHAEASLYNARYERPEMLRRIGDVTGLRILDAGCGPGHYCAALSPSARAIDAVDASEEMIRLLDAKALRNVRARAHDLARPLQWLESDSIDVAISSLTLHYLESWQGVFAEFYRVLVPNGRLIVSTHHPAMTAPLVEKYFQTQAVTDTWAVGGVDTPVSFFHRSIETIASAFIDAGFRIERLAEPHLDERDGVTHAERRLALEPWFLIIEARKA